VVGWKWWKCRPHKFDWHWPNLSVSFQLLCFSVFLILSSFFFLLGNSISRKRRRLNQQHYIASNIYKYIQFKVPSILQLHLSTMAVTMQPNFISFFVTFQFQFQFQFDYEHELQCIIMNRRRVEHCLSLGNGMWVIHHQVLISQ